jgi:hypothetical protein
MLSGVGTHFVVTHHTKGDRMAKRTIKLDEIKIQAEDETGVILRHYRWKTDYLIPSNVARQIGKKLIRAANAHEKSVAAQTLQERRDHGFVRA